MRTLSPPPPSRAAGRAVRDALAGHAAFGAVAVATLAAPVGDLGWRLLALVVLYNVALPVVGHWRGHTDWVRLWAFLVPLGAFLVVPDAFLAVVLGVLDFPDTGGPRVWELPLAMAGMWTVALWPPLYAADRLARGMLGWGVGWAAVLAGVVLVAAEATLWAVPIWRAVGVATVGPVAAYVVLPEVVLGAVAYVAYRSTVRKGLVARVAAAALVALVYLGALATAFLLIEGG
ncbi:DUF6989 domain-containing protein [Rubrivirga sp. IMCC43871]|uniref:DUF6989 domain-containing protein n=1 Tax=Rubrivirga sp. IMCC43871 TaxID=3391575 RepID=UPI003990362D